MKLNLGAGNSIKAGYINHDLNKHRKEIDWVFDLNEKNWGSYWLHEYKMVDEIIADDVIEHLDDAVSFMNNCWNVLEPKGRLKIKACGWQNPNFFVDITHKKGYDIRSFDYFDPSMDLGKQYGYYTDLKWKIIDKHYDRRRNIIIELEPIK